MVLRDRDANTDWDGTAGDGALEERRYICQNWRNDTALVATEAGVLVENAKFSGYGNSFNAPAGDVDSDGDWDSADAALITGGYDVNKDIDMDGSVGAGDLTAADAVTGGYHTEGRGVMSAEEVFIRKGYAGYEIDPILTGSDAQAFLHHVRHRVLSSYTGRWSRRDPLGYVDGMGLYEYVKGRTISAQDPDRLIAVACDYLTLIGVPFTNCSGIWGRYQPPCRTLYGPSPQCVSCCNTRASLYHDCCLCGPPTNLAACLAEEAPGLSFCIFSCGIAGPGTGPVRRPGRPTEIDPIIEPYIPNSLQPFAPHLWHHIPETECWWRVTVFPPGIAIHCGRNPNLPEAENPSIFPSYPWYPE